ncbi:MAG: hypothetical protein JHC98_03135 [Thermoleophilaceae bacterium]|nr:hypothetical protein [Thermoleophilaceae bacterium]
MAANPDRVTGWWLFAGVLLTVAGIADIIYGIAAIGDSKFFTENVTLIATDLKSYGWAILLIGVIQLTAGLSLFVGGGWGRFVGIIAAALNAIAYLLTIPSAPFWSLCMFLLSIVILYELSKSAPSENY